MKSNTIKIAVPNKGSLSEPAIALLNAAGYHCRRNKKDLFILDSQNNIEFYFLRPKNIATYVESGVFDIGITGQDILKNSPQDVEEILPLGFAKSSFYFIIKQDEKNIKYITDLENKTIATSYPQLVKNFLHNKGISHVKIIQLDGAVEISIKLGIADCIADVVETGSTLKQALLRQWGEPIFKSQATLIRNKKRNSCHLVDNFIKRLQDCIMAKEYVTIEYNIPNDKLKKAYQLYGGIEAPTITPLANVFSKKKDWYAVKVLIKKSSAYQAIDELSAIGAKAILVSNIEICRI